MESHRLPRSAVEAGRPSKVRGFSSGTEWPSPDSVVQSRRPGIIRLGKQALAWACQAYKRYRPVRGCRRNYSKMKNGRFQATSAVMAKPVAYNKRELDS